MKTDHDIYNEVGEILLSVAPKKATEIKFTAELSPENDHCKCEFSFLNKKTGNSEWFYPDQEVDGDLFDLLVELRNYYVANFKSQEKPFWHGCEVTVNLETLKVHFDFKYD